jgi:hypothetical protein
MVYHIAFAKRLSCVIFMTISLAIFSCRQTNESVKEVTGSKEVAENQNPTPSPPDSGKSKPIEKGPIVEPPVVEKPIKEVDVSTNAPDDEPPVIKAKQQAFNLKLGSLQTSTIHKLKYTYKGAKIETAPDNDEVKQYYIGTGVEKKIEKNVPSVFYQEVGTYAITIFSHDKTPMDTQYVTITHSWEDVKTKLEDLIYYTQNDNRQKIEEAKKIFKQFFASEKSKIEVYKSKKALTADTYNIEQFLLQLMAKPSIIPDISKVNSVVIEPNRKGEIVNIKIYHGS